MIYQNVAMPDGVKVEAISISIIYPIDYVCTFNVTRDMARRVINRVKKGKGKK